jgi:hypothetical protein
MARGSQVRQSRQVCSGAEFFGASKTLPRLLALLVVSICLAGSAGAQIPAKAPLGRAGGCAQEVWRNATDNIWFYDEAGGPVIPKVNSEWLVVHFFEDPAAEAVSEGELPPAIRRLSALFQKQIVDFVYDPALDPTLCMYRIRYPEKNSLIASDMARAEGGGLVRHIRPAYVLGDANFALLDEIAIRWKTQASAQERIVLLTKAGLIARTEAVAGNQQVRVDPCRVSTWETANLLHEDLHVVSAAPVLIKIEPPVRAVFRVGINGTTVGAPLPFALEIIFPKRIRIDPSTIANLNLCPRELAKNLFKVEYDRPLSSVDMTTSPVRIEGRLYLYGTGEFVLPEVPVFYKQAGTEETELVTIRTPEIPIRIASMIPAAVGSYQLKVADVKEGLAIRGVDLKREKILAVTLAAIGSTLLLLCLIGFRRSSRSGARSGPSDQGAGAAGEYESVLRGFLNAGRESPSTAEIAVFGRTMRAYLGARCSLPKNSMGGGTGVFYAKVHNALPPEVRSSVYELLELIDNGLSRGQFRQDEVDRIFEHARSVFLRYESNDSE